jgi:hypothetical protein
MDGDRIKGCNGCLGDVSIQPVGPSITLVEVVMKKSIIASLFVLALATFSALATPVDARAGMHHHGMMMHGGPIGFYLMHQDQLGLTPDQVRKLSKLKLDFMKTMIRERAQIKLLHLDTMALMMRHHINVQKVDRNMDLVLSHKKTIMHACTAMIANAHAVLTDDQFLTAKKLWREMMLMHHGMMHHPMLSPPHSSM